MHVLGDIATCMYYAGINPCTKQDIFVVRHRHDRKLQRELMQFFKPANHVMIR
ncbi:MAG TPA: DUF3362 domain-containing protein [Gemmataceae bacterium]|nr:DUF3362 domain-containing protein [Gemmataceae bacterium]